MSESFSAAVRERVHQAHAALEAARLGDDADERMRAEAAWEDARRFAQRHGVPLDEEAPGPGGEPAL
ncbi:hypothetical protein SAMN05421874_107107 [Nonomuraea maritima]|uniref:Uncharacterized protein n=1 Tax=Nonomuraea maritima TaxID=683260 RepID=A0A1G9BC56_9ACTN|nr:hypothetical protein [Nonomuraea maritima]SDK37039.1 hypothetical protein SAMN05421874_107107 [Nonomuraea maritima]